MLLRVPPGFLTSAFFEEETEETVSFQPTTLTHTVWQGEGTRYLLAATARAWNEL